MPDLLPFVPVVLGILQNVRNVDGALFQHGAAYHCAAAWAMRVLHFKLREVRSNFIDCGHANDPAVEFPNEGVLRLAETCCGLDNRVENGLQLVRRLADDAEHVAGRPLPLEYLTSSPLAFASSLMSSLVLRLRLACVRTGEAVLAAVSHRALGPSRQQFRTSDRTCGVPKPQR